MARWIWGTAQICRELYLPHHTPCQPAQEPEQNAAGPPAQELQHCKHTRIGEDVDGAVSGISGGERRRVSVGIGLVTDAHSIFLDEPTTGLDSDSAEALISLLSHLAVVKRRTVCCCCAPHSLVHLEGAGLFWLTERSACRIFFILAGRGDYQAGLRADQPAVTPGGGEAMHSALLEPAAEMQSSETACFRIAYDLLGNVPHGLPC